jgi:RNA polymerase sigma-54 factor
MAGPGLSLQASLVQRPELRQLLVAIQAQAARFLEMSDDATETWLSQQLKTNPALRRRSPQSRGGETASGFVGAPDGDAMPEDWSWKDNPDLQQHLIDQLRLEHTRDEERAAAEVIIFNLDDRGILAISLEEVARAAEVELEDAEDGQAVVMELEPEGCGASDLQEYLIFKVRSQFKEDRLFARLIGEYLDEFRDKNYKRIAKLGKVTEEQAAEYGRKLAEVSPFPAIGFSENPMEHVTPTVLITRVGAELKVEVQEPPRSRITLDKGYEERAKALPPGAERDDAMAQLEAAKHILSRMEHRTSLLYRIAEYAVREQRAWFDHGDEAMRNLTMDRAAEYLSEQRPNISRTVKGRYCLFEGRTFPLRDLFTHRSKPGRVSKNKLHALLQAIVDAEDKTAPLSDAAIAQELLKRGVREARRTVAKHRELAEIPPVQQRRRTEP